MVALEGFDGVHQQRIVQVACVFRVDRRSAQIACVGQALLQQRHTGIALARAQQRAVDDPRPCGQRLLAEAGIGIAQVAIGLELRTRLLEGGGQVAQSAHRKSRSPARPAGCRRVLGVPDRLHLGRIEAAPAQVLQRLQVGMAGQHLAAGRALGVAGGDALEPAQVGQVIGLRRQAVVGQALQLRQQAGETSTVPDPLGTLLPVEVEQRFLRAGSERQGTAGTAQLTLLQFGLQRVVRLASDCSGDCQLAADQQHCQHGCAFFRQTLNSQTSFAC
ncbi:hypothetical protein D3C78_992790 [compost metagenome]